MSPLSILKKNILVCMLVICDCVSGERVIICERESQHLSCDPPGVLSIQQSNYGRTTNAVRGHYSKTDCIASISLQRVRAICGGKQSCILNASNSVFGDPCGGIEKYLDVNYTCEELEITTTTNRPYETTTLEKTSTNRVVDKTSVAQSSTRPRLIDIVPSMSTSPLTTSTSGFCCCPPAYNKSISVTKELERKLQEIETKLKVFKNSTSRYRRRLISAPDQRVSAAVTGHIFGTMIIGMVILFFVLLDLLPRPRRKDKKHDIIKKTP